MTALATPAEVEARLEDDVTPQMASMIEAYLEDASDAARYYGREWTETSVPAAVRRLVASAVARFMRNPEYLAQSRAGDETLTFHDRDDIDWFTEKEIERIGRIANPRISGFGTMRFTAYGDSPAPRQWWGIPVGGSSTQPILLHEEE